MGITVIVSYPLSPSLQVEKLVRALVDIELEEWDFLKRFKLRIRTTKPVTELRIWIWRGCIKNNMINFFFLQHILYGLINECQIASVKMEFKYFISSTSTFFNFFIDFELNYKPLRIIVKINKLLIFIWTNMINDLYVI